MNTTTTTNAVQGIEDALVELVRVLGADRAAAVARDAFAAAGFGALTAGERAEAVRRLSQMGGAR